MVGDVNRDWNQPQLASQEGVWEAREESGRHLVPGDGQTWVESRERVGWQKPAGDGRGQHSLDRGLRMQDTAGPLLT